jgi:hypothetical protein
MGIMARVCRQVCNRRCHTSCEVYSGVRLEDVTETIGVELRAGVGYEVSMAYVRGWKSCLGGCGADKAQRLSLGLA